MTAPTRTQIPGYIAGTWDIDPVHSDVSFTVRHMMVSKVRGRLGTFSGEIVTARQFTDSTVDRDDRRQLDRHRQRPARQPHPLRRLLRGRDPPDAGPSGPRRSAPTATTTPSTAS